MHCSLGRPHDLSEEGIWALILASRCPSRRGPSTGSTYSFGSTERLAECRNSSAVQIDMTTYVRKQSRLSKRVTTMPFLRKSMAVNITGQSKDRERGVSLDRRSCLQTRVFRSVPGQRYTSFGTRLSTLRYLSITNKAETTISDLKLIQLCSVFSRVPTLLPGQEYGLP